MTFPGTIIPEHSNLQSTNPCPMTAETVLANQNHLLKASMQTLMAPISASAPIPYTNITLPTMPQHCPACYRCFKELIAQSRDIIQTQCCTVSLCAYCATLLLSGMIVLISSSNGAFALILLILHEQARYRVHFVQHIYSMDVHLLADVLLPQKELLHSR